MQLTLSTWNVNSVRARIPRLIEYINEQKPDVLLLQEIKCLEDSFPYLELESLGYNIAIKGQKSYNGVAILSKFPLDEVIKELPLYGLEKEDPAARYIEALINVDGTVVRIASVYVPNGGHINLEPNQKVNETDYFLHKLRFYDRLKKRFEESLRENEIALFGGDYNTCPEIFDMYSEKKDGQVCCHIDERIKFKEFLAIKMTDAFRKLNPDLQKFSWWDYRTSGWKNGRGLRLDQILSTPEAMKKMSSCVTHDQETRGKERPSDHAPTCCVLEV